MNVDHEIGLLKTEMARLGKPNADGQITVKFGVIVKDDRCANIFEALVGTLKAAKKRKVRWVGSRRKLGVEGAVAQGLGVTPPCAPLPTASSHQVITYSGELLLQGVHDNVDIVLLEP